MVAALLLGLTVAVIGFFAVMMWADSRDAHDGATPTTSAASMADMPGMASDAPASGSPQNGSLQSYAGAAPANADALAAAHKPYPAAWPRRPRCLSRTSP